MGLSRVCSVTLAENVEQQFKYTEPPLCKNPACTNTKNWQIDTEKSKFVDWQRVRVQENSDENTPRKFAPKCRCDIEARGRGEGEARG